MELFQEEEPVHDFLSLRAGGSSLFQHKQQHSTQQGYGLGGHDLEKPLDPAMQRSSGGAGDVGDGEVSAVAELGEHMLPGGAGTFSIRRVSDIQLREEAGIGRDAAGSGAMARTAPSTMWQDSGTEKRSRATIVEGRSSGSSEDQGPNSPRSKHSATEQRRRTKINDRLDVLRDLLQTAIRRETKLLSFWRFIDNLVIEYIRLLQEKVQTYESDIPEKNHVESKSMPWAKVYYRSRWRNTQDIKGGLSATLEDMNKEQYSSRGITVAPAPLMSTQSVRETSTTASSSHNVTENLMSNSQPQWLRMSTVNQDCDPNNRMTRKGETQSLHGDTNSLSSAYSQGLLNKLTEALKRSGVDPSQANISVEINMDRRARARDIIHDCTKVNEGKEPIHITKRLRCDRS